MFRLCYHVSPGRVSLLAIGETMRARFWMSTTEKPPLPFGGEGFQRSDTDRTGITVIPRRHHCQHRFSATSRAARFSRVNLVDLPRAALFEGRNFESGMFGITLRMNRFFEMNFTMARPAKRNPVLQFQPKRLIG